MIGAFHLAFVFQFQLSGDRRQCGVKIADAWDNDLLVVANGAALRVGNHVLGDRNRQALAHARTLVDLFILSRGKGNVFDHFANVFRNSQFAAVA